MKKNLKLTMALFITIVLVMTMFMPAITSIVVARNAFEGPEADHSNFWKLQFNGAISFGANPNDGDVDGGTSALIYYPNGNITLTGTDLYTVKEFDNNVNPPATFYVVYGKGNPHISVASVDDGYTVSYNNANIPEAGIDINIAAPTRQSIQLNFQNGAAQQQVPAGPKTLKVSYKNDENKTRGEVKFSIDNWTTPNTINQNETRNINVPDGRVLQLKIVPNNGYAIDWSGIELVLKTATNTTRYNLNEQANGAISGGLAGENGYTIDVNGDNITSVELENLEFRQDEMNNFNGNVWFVWNDNGALCKYLIQEVEPVRPVTPGNDEVILYTTKYVKASDVRDGTHTLDLTKMHNANEGADAQFLFINDARINELDGKTTWKQLMDYTKALDYDSFKALAYDPCGAVDGKTSISTNGDRGFRITIYNEGEYFGLTNATTLNDVTYYPSFWDPMFFNPIKDIWGSTLENPAVLETYIGEPVIKLASDDVGGRIDNIEFASSVHDDAVKITNDAGRFTIKFNSNYYDQVVFKIRSGDNYYYLRISRISLKASDEGAELYVPTTDENEYNVIATYYLKDGSEVSAILECGAGDEGGKNLDARLYQLSEADKAKVKSGRGATNPPVKVYYTVVRADSTPTLYKGTFSGSGKGVSYTINEYGRYNRNYTK